MLQDDGDSSEYSAADLLKVKAAGGLSSEALENFDLSSTALLKAMLLLGITLAVVLVLIVLIQLCIKKCSHRCHPKISKLCLILKHMLMFNSILRYFMMSFLSMSIGCCLQI